MNKIVNRHLRHVLIMTTGIILLSACSFHGVDRGQRYDDGKFSQLFSLVDHPNASGQPVNGDDFTRQVAQIAGTSPELHRSQNMLYQKIQQWLLSNTDTSKLRDYGINAWQMQGTDDYGNVRFTGYYTPVIQARTTRQGEFQYPIYRLPAKRKPLPSRRQIHAGALSDSDILAYSRSLMDNFIMGVQGSGYVDFANGEPPVFFGYGGKNGHPYRSIGKVLIDRNEVKKQDMSMQAILQWAKNHSESRVRELLEQNPSFVFFKPQGDAPVKGASAVPLIALASVASDPAIVPAGSVLLAEIPLLDNLGKFTGKYQLRLLIALDTGGAIKGQHFDIYQGIGDAAGHQAGWINHYGRVWLLQNTPAATSIISPALNQ